MLRQLRRRRRRRLIAKGAQFPRSTPTHTFVLDKPDFISVVCVCESVRPSVSLSKMCVQPLGAFMLSQVCNAMRSRALRPLNGNGNGVSNTIKRCINQTLACKCVNTKHTHTHTHTHLGAAAVGRAEEGARLRLFVYFLRVHPFKCLSCDT